MQVDGLSSLGELCKIASFPPLGCVLELSGKGPIAEGLQKHRIDCRQVVRRRVRSLLTLRDMQV